MTRQYDQIAICQDCGSTMTSETAFGRWLRNHPDLDSRCAGLSIMDTDYVFHRFRTELGRDFHCLMMVEVKKHGVVMRPAQYDTAHVLNQLLRNRRTTPTKRKRFQTERHNLMKVDSTLQKRKVWLRAFGVHVLTFAGRGPEDSLWIKWDSKPVTQEQLVALLRFDLDPDTLRPMDWRSHHTHQELLPDMLMEEEVLCKP